MISPKVLDGASRIGAAAGIAGGSLTAPAGNAMPVTFAQYVQHNFATQRSSISTANSTTTVTASAAMNFSFSGIAGPPVRWLPHVYSKE